MAYGTVTTNNYKKSTPGGAPASGLPVGGQVGVSIGVGASVGASNRANPPFALAKATNPLITHPLDDPRITRGYIRRDYDASDPTSAYRLNFMFNPESIQRSYVAYLSQGALDPYNTIYRAGNLVVPPGVLDFSFELIFDRQIETARDPKNRGCAVDFDYFNRVIRAVEPNKPASINNIPDNGVLMVNPRTTTVVFSKQLQVQGKISNATVSYDRFDHNMVPTRMRIGLQMKVVYVGSGLLNDAAFDLNITQSTATYAATIPYDRQVTATRGVESLTIEEYIQFLGADPFGALGLDLGGYSGDQANAGTGTGSGATSPGAGPAITGVTFPPNLGGSIGGSYYQMPEPTDGSYSFGGGTPANSRSGSRELIGVIYTVAKKWASTYPGSHLIVGDLNAPSGHVSHKKGVDVDITVSDRSAAHMPGGRDKSIQLGKWFIDTGIIKLILYNDTAVQAAVNAYAQQTGKSGHMQSYSGHNTHFHVRIADKYIAHH